MAITHAIPYVKTLELGRPKDAFAGDRIIQIGPDRVRDITEDESMNPDRFAFRRNARTVEIGTPIDAFFGMQEQYTAPSCATGDRQISCRDLTSRKCERYFRLLSCPPDCTGGFFSCECCKDVPTGTKECTCERATIVLPPPGPPGGPGFGPGPVPIGAIGTRVISQDGGGVGGGMLRTVLIIVGILAVGYFLYTRYGKKAVAAAA